MKRMARTALTSLLLVAMLIVAACGNNANTNNSTNNGATATPSGKKVVNIGVTYPPSNINPLQPVGLVSTYVASMLFVPLVEIDANLEYQPMLADSITTEDNTTFTIKLNEQAKWTDGTAITADDVVFTLELMTNPTVASNYAYMYAIIEGVDDYGYLPEGTKTISGVTKVDDHTVTIKTKNPTTLTIFQDTIGRSLLTLPKAQLENIAAAEINTSDFMQSPNVTSGPFVISKFDRDHYVEMTANKDYFKGAPKLEQLNFKVLQGTAVAAQLKSGEIDMNIPSAGVIPVSDHELVKGLSNVTTSYGQPLATQYLFINESVVPDAKQRQAISYAMNRELIVNSLLKGSGEVTDGFFTSISPYKNEAVKPVAYDLEKAKSLLAESGWNNSKTLTLSVVSGDATLEQAANVISENLREAGVNVKIEMLDFGTIVDKLSNLNYDMGILTVSITPVNPLGDIAYYVGEGNPTGYSNAKAKEIVNKLATEVDETKIKELYGQLQVIFQEDAFMPSIYATTALGAVNKRVVGASSSDFGMFINVHEWDIQ